MQKHTSQGTIKMKNLRCYVTPCNLIIFANKIRHQRNSIWLKESRVPSTPSVHQKCNCSAQYSCNCSAQYADGEIASTHRLKGESSSFEKKRSNQWTGRATATQRAAVNTKTVVEHAARCTVQYELTIKWHIWTFRAGVAGKQLYVMDTGTNILCKRCVR